MAEGWTENLLQEEVIFDCLLLLVHVYLLVWCHDSLPLVLKFQEIMYETVDIKEMIN
jgi:hypothetical protein